MVLNRLALGVALTSAACILAAGLTHAQPAPAVPGGPGGAPHSTQAFPSQPYPATMVTRDIAYGSDPKQKLDVFTPTLGVKRPRTVLIFVHGGAYRGGDKSVGGDFGYDNIPLWAANAGMVGVNINYRLFAGAGYPAQEQDLASAVKWVEANIASYGGDPGRIFLFGHSSGGAVVGNYASRPEFGRDASVRGLILLSSIMDLASYQTPWAYYGTSDKAKETELSPITTLVKTDIPILIGHGDTDSVTILPQMPLARAALCKAGHCPRYVVAKGDHEGVAHGVGGWNGADPAFGDAALAFIEETP